MLALLVATLRQCLACAAQTAGCAVDVVAALVDYGPGERSVGRACCLALCQAGAAQPLLKLITGEPHQPSSIKVPRIPHKAISWGTHLELCAVWLCLTLLMSIRSMATVFISR
jgi:hypothetical protein